MGSGRFFISAKEFRSESAEADEQRNSEAEITLSDPERAKRVEGESKDFLGDG